MGDEGLRTIRLWWAWTGGIAMGMCSIFLELSEWILALVTGFLLVALVLIALWSTKGDGT